MTRFIAFLACCLLLPLSAGAAEPREADFILKDFRFHTGETLKELRMHYTTMGEPKRDAQGNVTNAVLLLHGTTGKGEGFLKPRFGGILFAEGGLLDARRYFIIMPDNIGHGKSSKPSDGLKTKFPHYDYDDMVEAQYRLLTQGLKVQHLRLIFGTSMGCMHSFVWGEVHPNFASALMPMACLPVPIAGRNRMWRKMVVDALQADPVAGMREAVDWLIVAGNAPLQLQNAHPTPEAAEAYLAETRKTMQAEMNVDDLIYAVDSSRDYDPSARLEAITVPVMWINSADDFINPPELGIAEKMVTRLKKGRFVLLPATTETWGHATHSYAAVWKQYMEELLSKSQ